jgi:beta-glucuronidase
MMLYPIESETRQVKDLSGVWRFRLDASEEGFRKKWYKSHLEGAMEMPVPASYNDITQDVAVRDHIGWVWYQREFYAGAELCDKKVMLRVDAAAHKAKVWVNGVLVAEHKGGYLPFAGDVSDVLKLGGANRITIAIDNRLDWTTLPPGFIKEHHDDQHPRGYTTQEYLFDFFNYSGIHRPVRLVVTPRRFIDDITVLTDIKAGDGVVKYEVETSGRLAVAVRLLNEKGKAVAQASGAQGTMKVSRARLWQPGKAYLYTLEVSGMDKNGTLVDRYRLPVGIRTVKVKGSQFLINGKPFYFKGFGKHEDAALRGKGHDDVTNVKDFNLLAWIGANSFRTSHYPYSEEIMQLADRYGVVVIDEAPGVGMRFWGSEKDRLFEGESASARLEHHLQVMRELVARDKNHPCVVMWSIANEAKTEEPGAEKYFGRVLRETRKLDNTRPVTIVECAGWDKTRVAGMFDVVCVNRYFSWYSDNGRLDLVEKQVENECRRWFKKFRKPFIMSEYGADTIPGMHSEPAVMFTEEFQCQMLDAYHRAFDKCDFVVGEHVWNFADFQTKQGVMRVMGNKKGVFTRDRQPKMAAHMLRKRWLGK